MKGGIRIMPNTEDLKFLRQEGTFSGTYLKTEPLKTAPGCIIIFRPDSVNDGISSGSTEHALKIPAEIPQEATEAAARILSQMIRDKTDYTGAVKTIMYYNGWRYSEEDNENDVDIEKLVRSLKCGNHITIRLSKNWRGKHFYIRYLKIDDNGQESGYPTEADWRQATHSYPYAHSGTYEIRILHQNKFTNDFGKKAISLEICESTDTTFRRFRLLCVQGTKAFRILDNVTDEALLYHRYRILVNEDAATGKSYAVEAEDLDVDSKKHKTRKTSKKSLHNYRDERARALLNDQLSVSEFAVTGGVYEGEIADDPHMDFFSCDFNFVPVRLTDGRLLYVELRSAQKKSKEALQISNKTGVNDLTDRKRMFPGIKLTLYATPDRRKTHMIVRCLVIQSQAIDICRCEAAYLREQMIRDGMIPESERHTVIERMSSEELDSYQKLLLSMYKKKEVGTWE
jgi:hypothetical protein